MTSSSEIIMNAVDQEEILSEVGEESGDEEIDEIAQELPRFVFVEWKQLEKLFQRCQNCGKLPGGRSQNKPRVLKVSKTGSCINVSYKCNQCRENGKSADTRKRWSSQSYIPGTNTPVGNVSLVAAAITAPVPYQALSSFLRAVSSPFMSKQHFNLIARAYVWPAVDDYYKQTRDEIYDLVDGPVTISVDGQFDSPGYSAELCCVSAIEITTKCVLDLVVVHKSEVENVSVRMEKHGVIKLLDAIELGVSKVVVDKNPSVVAYLRFRGVDYGLDTWHTIRGKKKKISAAAKLMETKEEKAQLCSLGGRFVNHIYNATQTATDDARVQKIFSFFHHTTGRHVWDPEMICDSISHDFDQVSKKLKLRIGKKFLEDNSIRFHSFLKCDHEEEFETTNEPVDSNSPPFNTLLAIASDTAFLNDIQRLAAENITYYSESFHNVMIIYRPKRIGYRTKGFELRSKLGAIHYNKIRLAAIKGERRQSEQFEYSSKTTGKVKKVVKFFVDDTWKKDIVINSEMKKEIFGPGIPKLDDSDDDDDGAELPGDLMDFNIRLDEDEDIGDEEDEEYMEVE